MNELDLFAAALAVTDPAERAVLLDRECAGQPALRERLRQLLDAHARSNRQLDRPVPGDPDQTGTYVPNEQPGAVIAGRYKLLEAIGEGGMGTVWVAEQTRPVRRKVALKLIKAGMDSKSVLARFEAERQALAVMDHPNIAKVLDGGLTETGRPYFVMEYVKGMPITEYCDATRMSVSERLNLFVQVCQAVQHAHQKGIIHRDLKPSNILVAPYDDKPVPKVIDFGLAKAMHQSLTERTLHTAHETVLGTPLYMSPEQAQLNNLDVDTRSDIYSLGVLLYELLTGTTPLEKKRFKEAAWEEMKRLIREEEPPRPSTRLSSTNTLPSLAASRQTEPAKLTKLVRGELDWIVMKSLEKDRTHRYETANGFGADVQCYLSGEPVLAAPPSATYWMRKFARKHRTALTTAAALALFLMAGVVVSTWQAVRATRAERAALQAQQAEAERAEGERLAKLESQANERLAGERLVQIEAEKKKAEEEKRVAQAVKDFLQNKLLAQANPGTQANALLQAGESSSGAKVNPTIRELLDRAAKELTGDKIEGSFPKQPLVQAEILETIGSTYLWLGESQPAIDLLKRSEALRRQHLGPEHPDTLTSMSSLAHAYHGAGNLDLALPLFEETLRLRKAKLGPEHPDTLTTMSALALVYQSAGKLDLALPLCEESLKLRKAKLGPEDPNTLISMDILAGAYAAAGKLDLALSLYEEALRLCKAKLGPEHPETLVVMHDLAGAYQSAGKLDLALPLFEETLKLRKTKLGPEHPGTRASLSALTQAYQSAGKPELAVQLHEETLRFCKAKLGPEHPETLVVMHDLAVAYQSAGKLDLALPLFEETLKLRTAKLGPEHPDTFASMFALTQAYQSAGKPDLAVQLFEERLKLFKAKFGPEHPETLVVMHDLAGAYQSAGKLDLALPLFEETLKLRTAMLGPEHPDTFASMFALSQAYHGAGKPDLALQLFEEALKLSKAKLGPEHPDTLAGIYNLANAYQAAGKPDLALQLFEERLKLFKAKLGPEHPDTLSSMNDLAVAYQGAGKLDLALQLFEETLKLFRDKLGPDDPNTLFGMGSLARAYVAAGKPDLALPLFKERHKLMKAKFGPESDATLMCKNSVAWAYLVVAARQAWFGQDQELAATCGHALELAESNDPVSPTTLERVAKACCLRPSADKSRRAAALMLARKAVERGKGHPFLHYFQLALGMAEYRSGHFPEADAALIAIPEDYTGTGAFYLAMSLFRQGKLDEARQLANAATAKMKPLPKDEKDPLADNANHDDLILWLAYKEAKELIAFDATPAAAPRNNASPPLEN